MEIEQDEVSKAFIREGTRYLFGVLREKVKPSTWKRGFNEDTLRVACQDYLSSYDDAYGTVKVLGMSNPVSLHRIYTNVECNNPTFINAFESLQNLEERYRKDGQRSFYFGKGERRSGLAVANRTQFLNVLGDPGAGKTTFLKRVGLEALKPTSQRKKTTEETGKNANRKRVRVEEYSHRLIPVFIEFRRLDRDNYSLMRQLNAAFDRFRISDEGIEDALEEGLFLFLLDGLDEVKEGILAEVISDVSDFCNRYPKNRFITSCRTAYYKTYFKQFNDVVLAHFDDEQIKNFLKNWFHSQQDIERNTRAILFRKLKLKSNLPILELARTPLLLTFLCIVFGRSQSLPKNRSSLYHRALMILMDEWASEKLVHQDSALEELQADFEMLLLGEVASRAFLKDKIFFTEQELLSEFDRFFDQQRNVSERVKSLKVLRAIEIRQGLLVKRAEDAYSFSHLTIQEYLVAKHFSDKPSRQAIVPHVKERRWREVFRLMVGIRASCKFLDLMCDHANRELAGAGLGRDVIRWCRATAASGTYGEDTASTRALILSNALVDLYEAALEACRRDPSVKNTLAAVTIGRSFADSILILGFLKFSKRPKRLKSAIEANHSVLRDLNHYERALPDDMRGGLSTSSGSTLEDFDEEEVDWYFEELDSAFWIKNEVESDEAWKSYSQAYEDMKGEFFDPSNEQDRTLDNVGWDYDETLWFEVLKGEDRISFRQGDHLSSDLQIVDFTENSVQLLDYLYVQVLICECGQSSIDLTNDEWSEIEARLLS